MRMRRSRVTTHYLKSRITQKDKEGGTYVTYGAAVPFSGEVWPGSGKVQAQIYGEKLSYVRNFRVEGAYVITEDRSGITHYVYPDGLDIVESDGICLYVDADSEPDYKIRAVKPYRFLELEAVKL